MGAQLIQSHGQAQPAAAVSAYAVHDIVMVYSHLPFWMQQN